MADDAGGPASGETPRPRSGSAPEPDGGGAELLRDMKTLRRQARAARHAYWFPLVLFGLLTCASMPFYRLPSFPPRPGTYLMPGPSLPAFSGTPGLVASDLAGYWLAALLAGLVATQLWYRWHARRVGLRTPARGFLLTSAALALAAAVIPPLSMLRSPHWLRFLHRLQPLWPGDLIVRGTFPLLIIAGGLLVLAWAERSRPLAAIAVTYTATALLASLYDVSNLTYRLGWTPPPSAQALPSLALPALVLLAAGAGAFAAQRRRRPAA